MGWQDPRPQGAPAHRLLRVRRERASGHSAASSGTDRHRLGTGPLYDACILGVPGILEQQASAARMPAVLNQTLVPGGGRGPAGCDDRGVAALRTAERSEGVTDSTEYAAPADLMPTRSG